MSEQRCGRRTLGGGPCQNTLPYGGSNPHNVACRLHLSTEERIAMAAWEAGFNTAWREARRQEGYVVAVETTSPAPQVRMHTKSGLQIVKVGKYAYTWNGPDPLQVGDVVMVPENWLFPATRGTVTELGTTYDGALVPLDGLVERARVDA